MARVVPRSRVSLRPCFYSSCSGTVSTKYGSALVLLQCAHRKVTNMLRGAVSSSIKMRVIITASASLGRGVRLNKNIYVKGLA